MEEHGGSYESLLSIVRSSLTVSPLSRDSTLVSNYTDQQQDPIIGEKFGRVTLEESTEGWKLTSTLPIEMFLPRDISIHPIKWGELSSQESQGNALWKYSLGFLPALANQVDGLEAVSQILKSAWSWIKSDEWKDTSAWMTSLDHCVATRLRAMAMLRVQFESMSREVPDELFLFVDSDSRFVLENPSLMFPLNNHGAMAAIAALHASFVFPELSDVEGIGNSGTSDIERLARESLLRIIDDIFDEFGIANENSPEYQRYWISLLAPLEHLVELIVACSGDLANIREMQTSVSDRVSKISHALTAFVGNNYRMAPIGDTHPRVVQGELRDEMLVSEASGFATYRDGGTFLTFNSGSSNYAHKHCDDLSITLQRNGTDIFLDSGFFGHDWNDPRVIYTKSQTAHSGLFFDGLDNLHPGKLYFPGRERIRAELESTSSDDFSVVGKVWVDDSLVLERSIQVFSSSLIEIRDTVHQSSPELGRAWKRFILPLGARISFDKFRVEVDVGGEVVEILSDIQDVASAGTVSTAVEEPYLKGWVSPELNQLVPATCLELPCSVGTESTVRIVIR